MLFKAAVKINIILMKNYIFALITIGFFARVNAQITQLIPNSNDSRVITTGVPFLLIAADARAAGMGDMGVATSADAYSQQWNPSKYAFSLAKSGFGVSYTPYLSKLVNDISIGQLTYFNRLDERSAISGSFKYFSLGEIELVDGPNDTPRIDKNLMKLTIGFSVFITISRSIFNGSCITLFTLRP